MTHQKLDRPPNKFVKIGARGVSLQSLDRSVTVPVRLIEPCCNRDDDISSAAADKPRPTTNFNLPQRSFINDVTLEGDGGGGRRECDRLLQGRGIANRVMSH